MTNPITIVSGLPRSGTSMMMRLLEAGGFEILTDNLREADEDNPNGYYEFERVKEIKTDRTWLSSARGRVVKMVSMLLYELPSDQHYRIIFMKRDLNEICRSQRIMLERNGGQPTLQEQLLIDTYESHLEEMESWLARQQNMEVLYLVYGDIIENPGKSVRKINAFFSGMLDERRMLKVIDRSLYRQRNEDNPDGHGACQVQSTERDTDNVAIEAQLKALGYM